MKDVEIKKHPRVTHGLSYSSEYAAWCSMKDRCTNKNYRAYKHYGGRGIAVCERWMSFENFIAGMGMKPSSRHTLDRIEVNGNYEPNNCRWATYEEQHNNKRGAVEYNGKRQCLKTFAKEAGINYQAVLMRIRYGWTIREALETPLKTKNKNHV